MNPDPLSTNDRPMSYKDAAIVATVITVLTIATVYFPTHPYEAMVQDPNRYHYELAVFVMTQWITIFATLTGLTFYAKRYQSSE